MKLLNPYVMYKALKAKGIPLAFNSDSFRDQNGPVFDAASKEERALLKLISLGEQFANSGSTYLRAHGEALLQALDDLNDAGAFDREKEIDRSPLPVHPLEGGTLDLSLLEDGFPQDAVVIGGEKQ